MKTTRLTSRRDIRLVASAAIAALIVVEVEAASRATFDAVQASTAIAFRVVSSSNHVRLATGISLSLAASAVCLILLTRVASERTTHVDGNLVAATTQHFDPSVNWQNRLIRAARSGGALDR